MFLFQKKMALTLRRSHCAHIPHHTQAYVRASLERLHYRPFLESADHRHLLRRLSEEFGTPPSLDSVLRDATYARYLVAYLRRRSLIRHTANRGDESEQRRGTRGAREGARDGASDGEVGEGPNDSTRDRTTTRLGPAWRNGALSVIRAWLLVSGAVCTLTAQALALSNSNPSSVSRREKGGATTPTVSQPKLLHQLQLALNEAARSLADRPPLVYSL